MTARVLVGDHDDFLFLAQASTVVAPRPRTVWETVEADRQVLLLGALSNRFVQRRLLESFDDGYRCETVSRVRFGRRRSFESVVWLDPPTRSVEVQFGDRTDLRYEHTYESAAGGGTTVNCAQSYRAKTSTMGSGAALAQLRQRAEDVVAARVEVVDTLLGG